MTKAELSHGEIVQLSPTECRNPMFGACLMIVTEPKPWGAQGYVQALGVDGQIGGRAYYRATWEEMERTCGAAVWLPQDETEEAV